MPKVYITNKSAHNFEPAKEFGRLIYLSKGSIERYSTSRMYRTFLEGLVDSEEDDYLLPTSLSTMNMIAGIIFALKHRRINLLLFKDGGYVERTLVFDDIDVFQNELETVLQNEGAKALLKG